MTSRISYEETEEGFVLIPSDREEENYSQSNGRIYKKISSDTVEQEEMRYKTRRTIPICSMDGGGTRIAFSLEILLQLEQELAKETEKPDLKLGQVFKVFGGTSAGAITTLALNIPDPSNPKTPLYSVQKINDWFNKLAPAIFPHSYWDSMKSWTMNKPLYSRDQFHVHCEDFFKDVLVKDSLNETLIPVYQLNSGIHPLWLTRRMCASDFFAPLKMTDLLEMTTAAPSYYLPKEWNGFGFIDGGVYANNPTLATYLHAIEQYGSTCNYVACSFGTGMTPTTFDLGEFKPEAHGWGTLTWATEILGLVLNGTSESTHQSMQQIYYQNPKNYFRWQADIPATPLDTTDSKILDKLRDFAKKEKEEHQESWRRMVMTLSKVNDEENS